MKEKTASILQELCSRYPALLSVKAEVQAAFETLKTCFEKGGRLYVCGNGGSASDSEHIVGELMKSFKKARPIESALKDTLNACGELGETLSRDLEGGLPCVSLCGHPSLTSAFLNDKNGDWLLNAYSPIVTNPAGNPPLSFTFVAPSNACAPIEATSGRVISPSTTQAFWSTLV